MLVSIQLHLLARHRCVRLEVLRRLTLPRAKNLFVLYRRELTDGRRRAQIAKYAVLLLHARLIRDHVPLWLILVDLHVHNVTMHHPV